MFFVDAHFSPKQKLNYNDYNNKHFARFECVK